MQEKLEYFPTGSQLLDGILGGGWVVGRLINIQGDSQAGKTLLAEEAAANHLALWSDGPVVWRDSESAFAFEYADKIGIPTEKITFLEDIFTVEDWFNSVVALTESLTEDQHGLYVLDSLDALTDEAEMKRDIKEGTFGASKARKLSEIFRRVVPTIAGKNLTVIVIQQLRDQLNSPVPSKKASGGRGPEYYSSQTLKLSETNKNGKLKRSEGGVERIVGVQIQAKCTKNRAGKPWRDCKFKIMFDYGIDDAASNIAYLEEVDAITALSKITPIVIGKNEYTAEKNSTLFCKALLKLSSEEHRAKRIEIANLTKEVMAEVESRFAIDIKKY